MLPWLWVERPDGGRGGGVHPVDSPGAVGAELGEAEGGGEDPGALVVVGRRPGQGVSAGVGLQLVADLCKYM